MKLGKLLLPLVFSALTASAFASEPIQIDDLSKTTVFLDTDSIKRNGDGITFFLIFNTKEVGTSHGEKFKSFTTFISGNCKSNTAKQGAVVVYKEQLAKGKMILANPGEPSNDFVVPQQLVDQYVAGVCNAK